MDCDLIIRAENRNIGQQVTNRTIKLIVRIVESQPTTINLVISLKVYIGPVELKRPNQGITFAPKLSVVYIEVDFGSV